MRIDRERAEKRLRAWSAAVEWAYGASTLPYFVAGSCDDHYGLRRVRVSIDPGHPGRVNLLNTLLSPEECRSTAAALLRAADAAEEALEAISCDEETAASKGWND